MASSELIERMNYPSAHREHRWEAALWIMEHPENVPGVLKLCFSDEKELAYRAAWAFELTFIEEPSLLYPYFDYFFGMLPKAKLDQIVRPLAHICERLCIAFFKKKDSEVLDKLSYEQREVITECSFDWLITDQKVACQVRAMTCLYYLGTERDWVHPELKQILEEKLHTGTSGYVNRAQKTLDLIRKFRYES